MSIENGRPDIIAAASLRSVPLSERIPVARAAGFSAVGVRTFDYEHAVASGLTDSELKELLVVHDIRFDELEAPGDWVAWHAQRQFRVPEMDTVLRLADIFGARQLNVGLFGQQDFGEITRAAAALAERLESHGLRLSLEFLPYGRIDSLRFAQEIVESVAHPNLGYVIDAWHFFRSGATLDQLRALDPSRITSIQINDVAANPHYDQMHEARHHRLLPGQGTGDLQGLLCTLADLGLDRVPLEVETFSDRLDAMPPEQIAKDSYQAAMHVLSQLRRATAA